MKYRIVELAENQIPFVLSVQSELAIAPEILARGEKVAPNGFLISGHTEDDFRKYLANGGRLFGALNGNELVGYILTVPGRYFVEKITEAEFVWTDGVDVEQAQKLIQSGDYIYLDQIAIHWTHQKKGVSDNLLKRIEDEFSGQKFLSLVMISPIDNIRSRNFFNRQGFKKLCEIVFPHYGIMDGPRGILFKKS